jgi:hypothetical protein
MNARTLRAERWRVIFRSGRVMARLTAGPGPTFATAVNRGEWMHIPIRDWAVGAEDDRVELCRVDRWCYCSSLPGTGCDFCNGVRPVPNV